MVQIKVQAREGLHVIGVRRRLVVTLRRQLAQALKLHTILLAQNEGMRYIRTNNESRNMPMLAINRKLGYKPEPGIYRLVCEIK